MPETLQQRFATKTRPKSAPQKVTPQVIQYNPRTRLREKTAPPTTQDTAAPHATTGAAGHGLPSEVHPGGDYWYTEGPYWKRRALNSVLHTRADTRRARHQATHTLETNQGTSRWSNTRLVEDECTTQPAKASDKPWTGWTNFEEHQEFPTQFESVAEEQQQGTNAKAVQAPKQPTPQEILEHNVTRLPYRSWCPICAQARGRQNTHPKQHSKLPIIQLDFGYIKGFDDSNVHPVLTAVDIQSGMIMAIQLTDKRMLFDYAVTQLHHFLIELGRTTHTILQSDQEDFLTALTTAVANRNGNITTRNSGAYRSQSQGGVERRARGTLFAQVRTLNAQIRQNYNRGISMKHPLMPWIVRHSAHIMNRYAAHSNGCTSYFNRRKRATHTTL